MILKYNMDIKEGAIRANLNRLINQVYKLLPMREEGCNWQRPLETIMEELAGMDRMLFDQHTILFKLSCKLEGLFKLTEEDDFILFRSIIFECLNLLSELQKICQD